MPKYTPKKWHACKASDWTCENGVNCYAYALNNPKYYWAVPGFGFAHAKTQIYFDAFKKKFGALSTAEFRKCLIRGAKHDGLIPVFTPKAKKGYTLTALFFPRGQHDFHWYRQDDDGTWSHKVGYKKPTNTDEKGEIIRDPEKADRGEYKLFGGYFLVPDSGIRLEENFL